MSTPQATCIHVGLDRSRASLLKVVDVDVIGSDRYTVYNIVSPGLNAAFSALSSTFSAFRSTF